MRISSDRKQIILNIGSGFSFNLFKGLGTDKDRYDQFDFSFQIPELGSKVKLSGTMLQAIDSLRGEKHNIKSIKIIIDTKRKIPLSTKGDMG